MQLRSRRFFRCFGALTSALLLVVIGSADPAGAIVEAVVDPLNQTMHFTGSSDPIVTPGSAFQWSSLGFDSGNQELLPANMATLGGTPNDDGGTGPSFMEIDSSNNATTIVLAFNFPVGGISGTLVGNEAVTFDYSVYSLSERQILESLAGADTPLESGNDAQDIILTLIPEPASWISLVVGIAVLGRRRR